MNERPFRDLYFISIDYGEFEDEWTDDELIVDKLRENADSVEIYDPSYEENLGIDLELSKLGLKPEQERMENEIALYTFEDGDEVYSLTHSDSFVLFGEEDSIRENVFSEYLE